MPTPAAKDWIARRLRACGWLVWVLGAMGVVVVAREMWMEWPESLLRGRPGNQLFAQAFNVRVLPTEDKLPDGSRRWRIATNDESGPQEDLIVMVSIQDIGAFVPYGRIYRVMAVFRSDTDMALSPDGAQVGALAAEALRTWAVARPGLLPEALFGRDELIVDLGMKRRLLECIAAGAWSGAGAAGLGLVTAALAMSVARRCTRGWVLPSGSGAGTALRA